MIRLCSTSPTRAKILDKYNIEYLQSPIEFEEDSINANSAKSFVWQVVQGKKKVALDKYSLDIPILVADTVIEDFEGKILRKAKDIDDAKKILLRQSGKKISIISAAILKANDYEFIDISNTTYLFSEFDKDDLEKYLQSQDWQGKAGACMVEGFCKKYIEKTVGLESTAMGLQIEKIIPWIDFGRKVYG